MAMLMANTHIIPPKEFYHEPSLMTPKHNTVAMLLAQGGIIPPKDWLHKQDLINSQGLTVAKMIAIYCH